jgi:hypothetical protein
VDVNVLDRKITIEWETGTRVVVDADELAEQQERLARASGEGERRPPEPRSEPEPGPGPHQERP